jgi:hypothetical protein
MALILNSIGISSDQVGLIYIVDFLVYRHFFLVIHGNSAERTLNFELSEIFGELKLQTQFKISFFEFPCMILVRL